MNRLAACLAIALLTATSLSSTVYAYSDDPRKPQMKKTAAGSLMQTKDFIVQATNSNEFEVRSSQLALQKSNNPRIKEFAQHMITDHTKAMNDLKDALSRTDMSKAMPNELDAEHQAKINKLSNLSGAAFEEKYIKMQAEAHRKAVKLFDSYAHTGNESELREFAENTLPTLKAHKKHVMQLEEAY